MRRTDGNLRTLAAAQSGVVNIDAAAGTNSTATRLTMRNRTSIGIDFGTANTVVAIAKPGEAVRAITFRDDREKKSDIYRYALCFEQFAASRSSRSFCELEGDQGLSDLGLRKRFIRSCSGSASSISNGRFRVGISKAGLPTTSPGSSKPSITCCRPKECRSRRSITCS